MGDDGHVYLEISTWRGIGLGGKHYYGKLCGYVPEFRVVHLARAITGFEARMLNMRDGDIWEAGDETEGFVTQGAVIQKAINEYKGHFPKAEVLLLGIGAYRKPHKILDAAGISKEVTAALNVLCSEYERVEDSASFDFKDALTDLWRATLEKALSQG